MTLPSAQIISIIGIIGSLGFGYYLAKRKGDLKKLGIYFTPSRMKRRSKSTVFLVRGKYIPSIGVLNFFKLPKSNHKRICFHIFLTIENTSKYALEDVDIVLTYSRKLFDEKDDNFFDLTGRGSKRESKYMFYNDETMQVVYNYPSIHPRGMHQIIHPLIVSIEDRFKEIDLDDPLFFDVKSKDFCFDRIAYQISAKNLPSPVAGTFWVINVINNSYKLFFTREKKFLDTITRNYPFNRFIFENRDIEVYKEGKFKKDVLVVPVDKLQISYSHFPRLKEPNSNSFNFEQSVEIE